MRDKSDRPAHSRRFDIAGVAPHVLTVGAVLLAWQIAIQPLIQRAPVEFAIRIAPGSPLVLRRAAEAEFSVGRVDNAAVLGRETLARTPFDVRALRVVGLTEARAGRDDSADQMLTLAGNWSLRDDPAHAWLVEYRLRRGDYASAFAHADTLARRRTEIWPQVFKLFTLAASEDPQRVLPVLARLLAARPPWRAGYLTNIALSNDSLPVAANLAILLQSTPAPLTTSELEFFYSRAMDRGQIEAVKTVRARLNRPAVGTVVTNGGFDDPAAPAPFQWTLIQKSGATAEVVSDDTDKKNHALRVEYDGYSTASMARQQVFLEPGRYRLRAVSRTEAGEPTGRILWTLNCAPGGQPLLSVSAVPDATAGNPAWATSVADFSVPQACPGQWLELRGRPTDHRTSMVAWFDRVSIIARNSSQD